MTYGQQLATKIDAAVEAKESRDGMGNRLGAGDIGNPCMRQIWFKFHWADPEHIEGRKLRLFAHGQREEAIFTELLRMIGATVYTHADNGKQFRFEAHGGHFKGLLDGVAVNLPTLPGPTLCEFKTHNDKNFKILENKGVREGFPKHYKQAQTYLHSMNLKQCLYAGLNKNDESLYFELFAYDPALGAQLFDRAEAIIFAPGLPPRISETPAFWECRFCSMSGVCFKTKAARINCRTCQFSKPERDGTWSCAKGRSEIVETPKTGCGEYVVMEELKL